MRWLCWIVLVGCTPHPEPSPIAAASPSASSVAAAKPSKPATAPSRKVRVLSKGLAFLDVEDAPGMLTDSNAPPPPPGSSPATHPFVTASCYGGRPELCSKARDLLLASKSYAEFLDRLGEAGFTVEPR